ncbi:carbon storage regulator CsrA [Thermodesulfobacteriota bacterium]
MLVLTRKKNESIIIADDIEITVVDISKGHIKLGIKAPRNITVHRKEVYEAIKLENIEASKVSTTDISKLSGIFSKTDKEDK